MNLKDLKSKLEDIGEKTKSFFRPEKKRSLSLPSFGTQSLLSFAERVVQAVRQNRLSVYGRLVTLCLCAYFLADILAVLIGKFIPEPPALSVQDQRGGMFSRKSKAAYEVIYGRNLFNSNGLIPGEDSDTTFTPTGPAVPTTLPINLLGTLILEDETRSLGTLEDKGDARVYAVRMNDELPDKLRILQVEARRVTFLNLRNNRKEYVELPDDTPPGLQASIAPRPTLGGKAGVQQVSASHFRLGRSEIESQLKDWNKIITQARAVPYKENGVQIGWKVYQIVPGSIYEKLGITNNDVIIEADGEAVNDPGRIFQMINDLKTANNLELKIKRNGKVQSLVYDFN